MKKQDAIIDGVRELSVMPIPTLQLMFRHARVAVDHFEACEGAYRLPHLRAQDQPKHVQYWVNQRLVADRACRLIADELFRRAELPGECRYCGCREQSACFVNVSAGAFEPCGWIDSNSTACNEWRCLAEHRRHARKAVAR